MKRGGSICCRTSSEMLPNTERAERLCERPDNKTTLQSLVFLLVLTGTRLPPPSPRAQSRCRIIIGYFIDPRTEVLFLDFFHAVVRGRVQLPRTCAGFSVSRQVWFPAPQTSRVFERIAASQFRPRSFEGCGPRRRDLSAGEAETRCAVIGSRSTRISRLITGKQHLRY